MVDTQEGSVLYVCTEFEANSSMVVSAARPSHGVTKFYGWLRLMNSTAAYGGGSGAYATGVPQRGPGPELKKLKNFKSTYKQILLIFW